MTKYVVHQSSLFGQSPLLNGILFFCYYVDLKVYRCLSHVASYFVMQGRMEEALGDFDHSIELAPWVTPVCSPFVPS
jgi:hypothetical protein